MLFRSVKVTQVLRDGAAEQAGMAVGDELLAVNGWRVRRLEDALRVITPGVAAPLWVGRDQRVLSLPLTLPAAVSGGSVSLAAAPGPAQATLSLQEAWLAA